MENIQYFVKMNNEIYGPYSNEEMSSFDIPDNTPVATNPEGEWSTFQQYGFSGSEAQDYDYAINENDGLKDILVGLLWCGGGIAVTALTYSNASDGGTFVVAWGAILFGGIQFLKGLFHSIF